MEEYIGRLWHRWVTFIAYPGFPQAVVRLEEMAGLLPLFFRALGGDPDLSIKPASTIAHGAHRRLLQRIAGSFKKVDFAWQDDTTLYLPARLEYFPEWTLNRDLYLWLAALAACDDAADLDWFNRNQRASQIALNRFPGLQERYRRLVAMVFPLRPAPARLKATAAARELAVRAALQEPGSVDRLPEGRYPVYPVPLWLYPQPPSRKPLPVGADSENSTAGSVHPTADRRKRRAERTDMPEEKNRLLLPLRGESLFSWAEYVRVDRPTDEDTDPAAAQAADDLEVLAVARDNKPVAGRWRFDLDLPSEQEDDRPVGEGILLPEWDYKKRRLHPDYCRLQPLVSRHAVPCELPESLRRSARRLKQQFQGLTPRRLRLKSQIQGDALDIDAYVRFHAEHSRGQLWREPGLYQDTRRQGHELACLLLADLSLSTDAWINDQARVIDVIRDSLFLFAEALSASGDQFGLYGFSSVRRHQVRWQVLKDFQQAYNAIVRGHIAAIRPGFYTRMGAAIRYAIRLLAQRQVARRLLLLLTDGKPNDLDRYEGRYGAEDTRMAVLETRRQGLTPFCITIDRQADDYLPHLFGPSGYIVVRKAADLPRELPRLYAQLTH
ncbi:MAG: VWA domain-containing protein [Candidatus Competibacteraceae bacterium]